VIDRSALSATGSTDGDDASTDVTAVRIIGAATGTTLEDSYVLSSFGRSTTSGVLATSCSGAGPLVSGNIVRASSDSTLGQSTATLAGISIAGDCEPAVDSNDVLAAGDTGTLATGIACSLARCTITGNTASTTSNIDVRSPGSSAVGVGVFCEGCAEVSQNSITGIAGTNGCTRDCRRDAMGLQVFGDETRVSGNDVSAGEAGGPLGVDSGTAYGLYASGTVRIENNVIDGGYPAPNGTVTLTYGVGIGGGPVDLDSNFIRAGGPNSGVCSAAAVRLLAANQALVRNDIISANPTACGAGIEEATFEADPAVVENNDLSHAVPLYRDQGGPDAQTAAEVNALTDLVASGNFTAGCSVPLDASSPCIDAGTPAGAPAFDRDGEPRSDGLPDVGPDEFGVSPCAGVTCSGHGTCERAGASASCSCDPGFEPSESDPLTCEDVNECAVMNGGCDALTTCTNEPGTRSCGPCPDGYTGNGEVGCTVASACSANPCGRGATCYDVDSGYVCDCPAGTFGSRCELALSSLTVGSFHACGLLPDGTPHCWGSNDYGQATPAPGKYQVLAANQDYTCGLRDDGTLACFGSNDYGRTTPPAGTFTALAAGSTNACALRDDGTLACWGLDTFGQSSPPGGVFKAVAVGGAHGCAIAADDSVACWGRNDVGQTNPPPGAFSMLAAGGDTTCGLHADGSVACWGRNDAGQASPPSGAFSGLIAGDTYMCASASDHTLTCWGDVADVRPPPPSSSLDPVAAGPSGGCGVQAAGNVVCWGSNGNGRLPGGAFSAIGAGSAIRMDGTLAADVSGYPSGAFRALGDGNGSCAIRTEGTLACWGNDYYGEAEPPAGTFLAVGNGQSHRCAVRTDHTLACWGTNAVGEGSPPSGTFDDVSAGANFGCGVRSDGTLACWGNLTGGQAAVPVGTFRAISATYMFACGLRTDGTLACWGDNSVHQASPPAGVFTAVSAGVEHACALDASGEVTCWGASDFGETNPPPGPFIAVSAGSHSTCALRPDRTLVCFGASVL
jgi:alpha-tubulin suppressor-like RCC1 family protein